jgi:DNA polymerase, archaea type
MIWLKNAGWILDLYQRDGKMIVWLRKEDGSCVRLVDDWKPRVHVCGTPRDLLDLACKSYVPNSRFVEKFEKPGDRKKSRILEIGVNSEREAASLARKIQKQGSYAKFRLYDVDVPAPQMYLYQHELFPLALVEAEQNGTTVDWTLKDSREKTDYQLPNFRTVKLGLTTTRQGRLQSLEDQLDKVELVSDQQTWTIDSGGEKEKILRLTEVFREIDPDIVLTEGGDSFVFPFLTRRAQELGILDQLVLGREASPLQVYDVQGHSYFSYGKILYRETAARLLGRLHVDNRNGFISRDCDLEGLFEVSRTCIIPTQRSSRATIGTNMTSLQLYNAVKEDVLVPWNKNEAEEWKDERELVVADRGGFVYEPQMGIHDEVGEIDFSSLYPTLMLKHNLSGETVKCNCCPDSTLRVPELDYNICQRWEGIVPRSLGILLRKKMSFKKLKKEWAGTPEGDLYDKRQAALKWILVCSFGYLGFKNARFGKIDAHIATCAFARKALKEAKEIVASNGFSLVHGIVDSMWLRKPGASVEEYERLCAELKGKLDLPISFEGLYKWIAFLASRVNPRVPVLNRYFGVFQDGTIKFRGIELRRHDTPGLVEKCQRSMIALLSEACNTDQFKALAPEALKVLEEYVCLVRTDRVPVDDLVITKNLSKGPGEYTKKIPHPLAARRLEKEGGKVHAGQSINYILTKENLAGPETRALPSELAYESVVDVDREKYVDLLVSSARNLLEPCGYDRERIMEGLGCIGEN